MLFAENMKNEDCWGIGSGISFNKFSSDNLSGLNLASRIRNDRKILPNHHTFTGKPIDWSPYMKILKGK